MNRLEKQGDKYTLICGDESFACTVITEAKTGRDYVKLPKDNPSGRTFVSVTKFENTDTIEFETKTEHRTGLSGGGWRAKMTEAEKTEVAELEKRIEEIKTEASKRETPKAPKADLSTEEGIEAEIARLMAKQAKLKAAKTPEPASTPKKSKK